MTRGRCTAAVLVFLGVAACKPQPVADGQGGNTPAAPLESSQLDTSAPQEGRPTADEDPGPLAEALGLGGDDCPDAGSDADAAIAAQATAQLPLKVGLTLTDMWTPTAREEYECLTQVTAVSRRSNAVRQALVQRFSIAPERLTTAGYGAAAPKDSNETPEGRARNRRVELVRQ